MSILAVLDLPIGKYAVQNVATCKGKCRAKKTAMHAKSTPIMEKQGLIDSDVEIV